MPLSGIIIKSAKYRQQFRKSVENLHTKTDPIVIVKKKRQYQYKVPLFRIGLEDSNKENVLFSDKEHHVDLYCNETMDEIFKIPEKDCAIILNEKDEEIARIASELKSIFHGMKKNEEYSCITQKRTKVIQTMMQMYQKFKFNGITQAVVVLSVALMDWIGVHRRDYFCEENQMRISCLCIIESMKSIEDNLHLEHIYKASCKLIYGDESEENTQNFRQNSELLESIISVGNYRDSSYMTLLGIYIDYMDEPMQDLLTELCFKKLSVETKYRLTDMYEEFVESVIQNSQNTSLNLEIMHDYVTALSR